MENNIENGKNGERNLFSSAQPLSHKVVELRNELETLKQENDKVASKFESKSTGQGCLGLAIITASTIIGVIVGFGFLSIFTGIGGFVIGLMFAAPLMRSSPEMAAYEKRKARIAEIENLLSQVQ